MKQILVLASLFVAMAPLIVGCSLGGSTPSLVPPTTDSVELLGSELVSYDLQKATLNFKGNLHIEVFTELNEISVYTNPTCSGEMVGSGIEKDFSSKGVSVSLSSVNSTSLYVKTNTVATCMYLTTYKPQFDAPVFPTTFLSQPMSPSRATTTPLISGTPSPFMSKIEFYDDAQCSHLVGAGNTDDFRLSGVSVSLVANKINKIYGIVQEPFGKKSSCNWILDFKHTTEGPLPPVFGAVSPLSPNNFSTNPSITGTFPNPINSVKLFSDPNCSVMIGQGSASEFSSGGVMASVKENTVTDIYGIAIDNSDNPSTCAFLTRYIHDTLPPALPQYQSATPTSPTRLTTYPKIAGLTSSDTATLRFYNGITCLNQVGSGTKATFESTGIPVNVGFNSITSIYAVGVDQAGNKSNCVLLTNYRHNTIPPDPPVFNTTNPISPTNKSFTPLIFGNTSETALYVSFYNDETCSHNIGNGTAQDFFYSGIQINATSNATTTVYGTAQDLEGNVSACAPLTNYMHSTATAPSPSFTSTNPPSPSRTSFKPWVVGSVSNTVSSIFIYSDSSCTSALGTGSRSTFITTGIAVTLPKNAQSALYAKSVDVYGNDSNCVFMTNYIHDDRVPLAPVFASTSPASPNNVSASPLIKGSTSNDPLKVLPITQVAIYDSSLCINRVGLGTPAEYAGLGIVSNLAANAINSVYGQTIDDAGNMSPCTSLLTYMHSNIPPGKPQFASVTPNTPSYSNVTKIKGTLGPSTDFMTVASIDFYSDSSCSSLIASGLHSDFIGGGVLLNLASNVTTSIYALSRDIVGNSSTCQSMVNFQHSDLPPANVTATSNSDGSITLAWSPDLVASPTPVYRIKRSLVSGGPYSLIHSSVMGSNFKDTMITAGATYFYKITATNNTGRSQDSVEVSGTASPSSAISPTGLIATPGPGLVNLTWTGFGVNANYRVYRSTQHGGPYQALSNLLTATTYDDLAVTNGTPYYYVVTGMNAAGESFQSVEASVVPLDVPNSPLNLTLSVDSASPNCSGGPGVHLSWSATAYQSGYRIYRGMSSGSLGFLSNTGSTEYVDCGPGVNFGDTNSNKNYYRVAAIWGSITSATSNEVVFANMLPTTLKVDAGVSTNFVYWSSITGASTYQVERSQSVAGPFQVLVSGTGTTSYLDSAVSNDVTYYYRVKAEFSTGQYGWYSAVISGMPHSSPSAPSNLSLIIKNKLPDLSWSAPSHYDGFNVYRSSSLGGPYTLLNRVSSPNYTDSSPMNNMNYYQIKAIWGTGETAATNIVSFRGGQVGSLAATVTSTTITLNWAALGGVSNYSIYRSTTSGGPYTLVSTGSATNYVDSNAVSATGYFYVVVGNFIDGTQTQWSTEVSGMLTGTNIPSGLTVISTTGSSVKLAWASVKNASSYKAYYSTNSAGPFTSYQITTTNSINLSGLTGQTRYYFKVSSLVGSSYSSLSSSVNAYTYGSPSAPALTLGTNQIDLMWNSVTGASSYSVERTTDGSTFTTVATGLPMITYSDNGVTNGSQYFYRVNAFFPTGLSTTSPISLGGTPGVTPIVPQGLEVTQNATGTDVVLNWGAILGATTYKVYVSTSSGGPWGVAAASTSVNTATLSGLVGGTRYFAVVTALIGTMESSYSQQISFIPEVTPIAPTASAVGPTSVSLTWPAVSGAASYDILRSEDRSNFEVISSSYASTTFVDNAVVGGQSYVYRYHPRSAAGVLMAVSSSSNDVEVSVVPVTPSGLRGIATTSTSIQIDWISASGATQYSVYRSASSGGPFVKIQTLNAPTNTFNDIGLVAGNDYFYRLRSVNSVGVESADSSTIAVALVVAPTGLAALNVGSTIQLNWNSVGGASGYQLSRSTVAGGPYGVIFSSPSLTSFTDSQIENGVTYYYIVQALSAGGGTSMFSGEISKVGIVQMNLEVPIELTDAALASMTIVQSFERTQTTLDTNAYDGTVTYSLELHASNIDAQARSVELINSQGVIVATVSVPSGTNQTTRFTTTFNPTNGSEVYRLKLDGTTTNSELEVAAARILVKQVNATKTKIFYPLLNAYVSPSHIDAGAFVASTNQQGLTEIQTASIFEKNSQNLSLIQEGNGWELEVVTASTNGAEGSAVLYNRSTNQVVENTELIVNSNSLKVARSPFGSGSSGFDAGTDGQHYDIRIKCDLNCGSGTIDLYKAGLWVTLRSLYKVEIIYRLGRSMSIMGNSYILSERSFFESITFSNPFIAFAATGYSNQSDSATIQLINIGMSDTGVGSPTTIPSSSLNFSTATKGFQKSGYNLSVPSPGRNIPEVIINSGSFQLIESQLRVLATP